MKRTARVALAALLIAPLGAIVTDVAPAAAAPPTLSAAAGAPGTVVEVTIPDCVTDEGAGRYAFVQALLISGTAPNEVVAGAGGGEEGTARIVVPDWLDPAEPAVIEASCFSFEVDTETETVTPADPVAFDVLAGPGAPTQTRTFSRTSVLVGQGFGVDGSGCDLPGAEVAGVDVFPGDDPSGRSFEYSVASGFGFTSGSSFSVSTLLAPGTASLELDIGPDGVESISGTEEPSELVPGTYTAVAYCSDGNGLSLLYEPETVEVTGSAPVDQIDLTIPTGSRAATLAGGACTEGDVSLALETISLGDLEEEFGSLDAAMTSRADRLADRPAAGPFVARRSERDTARSIPVGPRSLGAAGGATRALADDEYVEAVVTPGGDGAWSFTDTAGFDQGVVFGYAVCGDPLADGFLYDVQAADVDVAAAVPPTTTPGTTPVAPVASPATAVRGTPTYTG